jgi:glutathione peroxidase
MAGIYDFKVKDIHGKSVGLDRYKGKVMLIVNTASQCGFTPQYKGLEALHQKLHDKGLAVLGFPCNQFGGQEPGSDLEIREFCSTRYDVTFPLASKLEVNGPGRHALYAWLTAAANGHPGDIAWNFEKFLIGRGGQLLARYPSGTRPEDKGLMTDIAAALQGA